MPVSCKVPQRMTILKSVEEEIKEYDIKVNTGKTKVMRIKDKVII